MKVLQFSGGLDSLACLHLLRSERNLVVLTATTDGAYPERQEYLTRVAAAHPHLTFKQVFGERSLAKYGYPVDVVPVKYTTIGNLTQGAPVRYQPYIECCNRALWLPLNQAVHDLGATTVYRGQRNDDVHKAPIRDGHVDNGITYRFPIENWSRLEVKQYLEMSCPELIPAYYDTEKSSHDCVDCTAYLADNASRINHLPVVHYVTVKRVLDQWRADIDEETRW